MLLSYHINYNYSISPFQRMSSIEGNQKDECCNSVNQTAISEEGLAKTHLPSSISSNSPQQRGQKNCSHCQELEGKIRFLQQQIQKLQAKSRRNCNPDANSSTKPTTPASSFCPDSAGKFTCQLPFRPGSYTFDLEAEKQMLDKLEKKAQELCDKERKERDILKKMINGKENSNQKGSSMKKSKKEKSAQNWNNATPDRTNQPKTTKFEESLQNSAEKAEQIEKHMNEMLEGSQTKQKSEYSDLSGSITSERKSMIEKMSPEEREAYYNNQMKNRKLMGKLKKHRKHK